MAKIKITMTFEYTPNPMNYRVFDNSVTIKEIQETPAPSLTPAQMLELDLQNFKDDSYLAMEVAEGNNLQFTGEVIED